MFAFEETESYPVSEEGMMQFIPPVHLRRGVRAWQQMHRRDYLYVYRVSDIVS